MAVEVLGTLAIVLLALAAASRRLDALSSRQMNTWAGCSAVPSSRPSAAPVRTEAGEWLPASARRKAAVKAGHAGSARIRPTWAGRVTRKMPS